MCTLFALPVHCQHDGRVGIFLMLLILPPQSRNHGNSISRETYGWVWGRGGKTHSRPDTLSEGNKTLFYYLFIIVIFIFIYIYILLINNFLYLFIIIYNTLPLVPFWDLFALPPWTLASFLSLLCSSMLPGLSVCPCVLLQEYTSQVQSLVQPY